MFADSLLILLPHFRDFTGRAHCNMRSAGRFTNASNGGSCRHAPNVGGQVSRVPIYFESDACNVDSDTICHVYSRSMTERSWSERILEDDQ